MLLNLDSRMLSRYLKQLISIASKPAVSIISFRNCTLTDFNTNIWVILKSIQPNWNSIYTFKDKLFQTNSLSLITFLPLFFLMFCILIHVTLCSQFPEPKWRSKSVLAFTSHNQWPSQKSIFTSHFHREYLQLTQCLILIKFSLVSLE